MNRDEIIRMAQEAGLIRAGENYTEPARWGISEIMVFYRLAVTAEREKALRLWMLLDDIDTADDIAKSDDKLYRKICQNHQKNRWHILSGDEVDEAIQARKTHD